MRRSRLILGLFTLPFSLFASPAIASPSDCGNIDMLASGDCSVDVSGGCSARCTPVNVTAVCDSQCTATPEVSCTGVCETDCSTKCEAQPAQFDCQTYCGTDCYAGCDTNCTDSSCTTDCQASCDNRCAVQCREVQPASMTCTEMCQTSCNASCTVQVNLDCRTSCDASITGGCQTACSQPQGALFCGGQYVNVTGSLASCEAEIAANFAVSAACSGNTCTASAKCSVGPGVGLPADRSGVAGIATAMVGIGLLAARRRRRAA